MDQIALDQVDPLFQVNIECMNCEQSFKTSRVRPSFKRPHHKDTDFCNYYKEINPEYYVVRVCPHCGFASTENFENNMTDTQRRVFLDKVSYQWVTRDYGGERTWDDALKTYQLALLSAQIKEESPRVIAGLLHHIAWLYREKGDREQEERFLEYALEAYIRVYEYEQADVSNARLMYMIGELSRRLKKYSDAIKWFGRVINDHRIMDSAMIRACREQWAATREDMLADQLELPEEMAEGN